MYTLTLNGVVRHEGILLIEALLIAKTSFSLKGRKL
jgi:hypothetical protein